MRLLLLFLLLFYFDSYSQVDVVFRVDMQYQSVSENGVHVAGSMQGWTASSTPLNDDNGDGIWEVTLSLSSNSNYEYKFINGNSWGSDESVWGDCGAGNGNRILATANQNMILPAYVFNSCDFTAYGCTDPNATNYDASANNDDGSCEYLQIEGCTDTLACNYNPTANIDDSTCVFAAQGYDCDSNCVVQNIEWIGDQNGDGFVSIDPNSGNAYITIESYPNIGTASILINEEVFSMNYTDWGENAHWYIPLELSPNNTYNWTIEVSNLCATSQSYSSDFTTDCQNILNGSNEDLGCGCGEPEQQAGYDCDGNCLIDTDLDGICDEFEVEGCTDSIATNFNPLATDDDGSCEYLQIEGCTDTLACNYNPTANIDDSTCVFAAQGYDCDSNCVVQNIEWIGDQNGDGFVSIDPNSGNAYITIESYPNIGTASILINEEVFSMNYTDWGENAHWYIPLELSPNNTYNWTIEVSNLCATSQSYSSDFTTDCQNILNGSNEDLGCGCGEPEQQAGYDCDGNCLIDTDLDGICDEFEVEGCTDSIATNFNPLATDDDGSCEYLQIEGCTDTLACNYNPTANIDDSTCVFAAQGYDCDSNCVVQNIEWIGDQNGDGFVSIDPNSGNAYITIESYPNIGTASILINEEVFSMNYTDWGENAHWYIPLELSPNNTYNWTIEVSNLCATSQSYSSDFTTDCQNILNGSNEDLGCGCGEPEQQAGYDCDGNCLIDTDLDGICDEFEVEGCTDSIATNFNPLATDDDGSCEYLQIEGCTDTLACNYNPTANIDDSTCVYLQLNLLSDTNLCSSTSLNISVSNAFESYLWSNGDTTNMTQINQPGVYFVTVSNLGCQTTDTINVTYSPLPYIDVGDVFYLCPDSYLDLELSDEWSSTLLIDFESSDTIFENAILNLTAPGQYQIIVTDSIGCIGYDVFEIVESSDPVANFNYTVLENLLTTNNLSINANYFEWQIINHNEIIIDTSQNLSVNIELCNNDSIVLIAHNDCGSDTMISVINPTKIETLNEEVSIYPNPFIDEINLIGFDRFNSFYLKDINGKIIKFGEPKKALYFKDISQGFYNLILLSNDKYYSKKIIKN